MGCDTHATDVSGYAVLRALTAPAPENHVCHVGFACKGGRALHVAYQVQVQSFLLSTKLFLCLGQSGWFIMHQRCVCLFASMTCHSLPLFGQQ